MKLLTARHISTTAIRCCLILLFSYTAITKWLFYDDLVYQLQRSPFLPAGYRFLSVALPVTEIGISVLLLLNATAKGALAAAAVLLFLFTVYIICMLSFAPSVPCSCGGFISSLSWTQHIELNSFLFTAAVGGYFLQPSRKKGITFN